MTQDPKTQLPSAAPSTSAAAKRYLSQLMDYAFQEGWRTPDDFVRYFPAHSIMAALKGAPELRVKLLAAATGIYEEILRRKTPALAAEDLRIALEEGTTNSLQLLAVFTPEDRVRYLEPQRIWDFLAEDQFWHLEADAGEEQRRGAAERMAFTLTQALQERLLTLREVFDGISHDAIADALAPHELRAVVRFAMAKGREGTVLSEKVLLDVLPLEKIVRSVPLDHIWREVVVRRLAVPCGFTDVAREERRSSQVSQQLASDRARAWSSRPSGPPALPPEYGGRSNGEQITTSLPPVGNTGAEPQAGYGGAPYGSGERAANDDSPTAAPPPVALLHEGSMLPPPLSHDEPALHADAQRTALADFSSAPDEYTRPVHVPQLDAPYDGMASDVGHAAPPPSQPSSVRPPAPASADSAAAEERQRQRVIEHLRAIGRLPPNHASLASAVLRSIDAMYALLPSATDDIQRKSVIRQTFANENHLRAALLGLIELMDSSVDTSDPVIQGAKIEALIKILLFEEQRRKETGRFPTGGYGSYGAAGPSSGRAPLSFPPSSYPPGSIPPPNLPDEYPNPEGYYPAAPGSQPPAAMLGAVPGYPPSAPPLPNLPADPVSSRRRTVPPPLPPSYPRG